MPIAVNPADGRTVFLAEDGSWQPAQTAVHPETKKMMAYDGSAWVDVPAKSKGVLGYIDDAVRSIASGVTFGFADEIAAKGNELLGSGSYEQNLKDEQARDASISGWTKIPGEIAGAVGGAVAAAPVTGAMAAASGLARLPGLAKAVLAGGAGGAAFGAGNADPGLENRATGAATGAGIGTVAGGVLYPVIRGAQALGREISGAMQPQQNVSRDLGRALQRDEMTPEQLIARADELNAVRPGVATLADAGGENVRGLVERIAQTPGAGRTTVVPALTDRQKGQLARVSSDLTELTGTRRTAFQATQDTIAERKAASVPAYTQAYQDGDRLIWGEAIQELTGSPAVQSAMRRAINQWQDSVIAQGYGAMNPGAVVEGGMLKMLGGRVPAFPNLQFWDLTKQALDKMVEAQKRPDGSLTKRGGELAIITGKLRDAVDNIVPSYKTARDAWAGPSNYLDAIEEGSKIFNTKVTAEQLAAAMPHMSAAEREGFTLGVVATAVNKMRADPAKMADYTKYVRSPEMRDKIAAVMPTPEARQAWFDRLNFEVASSEQTGRALGNSATARRLAERADAEGIVGDLVMDAFSGRPPVSLLRSAVMTVPQHLRDTLRSRSDDILAELLTTPGGLSGPQLRQALERAATRGLPSPVPAAPINAVNAYGQSR